MPVQKKKVPEVKRGDFVFIKGLRYYSYNKHRQKEIDFYGYVTGLGWQSIHVYPIPLAATIKQLGPDALGDHWSIHHSEENKSPVITLIDPKDIKFDSIATVLFLLTPRPKIRIHNIVRNAIFTAKELKVPRLSAKKWQYVAGRK